MPVTHKGAAKKPDEFSLGRAATYVCRARIHYSEKRKGSMPLLFERLLEKIYNSMITQEKLVPGREPNPRNFLNRFRVL
jgi:hypothetical protein